MIRIRAQQLEAFATHQAEAFVDALLAEVAPLATDGVSRAVVVAGVEAAVARGFRTPEGIRGFVRRLFVFGTTYYQHVAVRDWIGECGLGEDERLAIVDAHAVEIAATRQA